MPIIACGLRVRSARASSVYLISRPPAQGALAREGDQLAFRPPQVTTDICHSGTAEVSPNPKKSQQPQNRNLRKSFLSAQTTPALIRAGRKPVWV